MESDSSAVSSKHKDLQRLQEIFFEVAECKDDSQQRGWAVHDDEGAISGLLEELLQILVSAGVLGEWVWLTHPCNWCVRTNGPVEFIIRSRLEWRAFSYMEVAVCQFKPI